MHSIHPLLSIFVQKPIVIDDDGGSANGVIDVDRFTGGFLNDDFKLQAPIERNASTGSEHQVVAEPIDNSNTCRIDFHVTAEQLDSWENGSMNFSPVVNWKGGSWKLLVKPYIDQYERKYSLYLGLEKTTDMPLNFNVRVNYGFVFESRTERTYYGDEEKQGVHLFYDKAFGNGDYIDQGFEKLLDMDIVKTRAINDVPCFFRCSFYEVRNKFNYSSKKETGMVGLENLGATCYLNALLQMLYHLNAFRRAVYEMPNEGEEIQNSTTLALQSLFHRLQTDVDQVTTRELTKAFGWNSLDSFMQQDVQEMMRILLDKLEEKMKGSSVEHAIKTLFCGKVKSYVRCVNVEFESSREEEFYDIQLDVKGCDNIYQSFQKYIEKEMLEGDNKYDAGDEYGKQDAQKGVIFTQFPPVLTIQLKRFDFDMTRMCFGKVHDKLEYPPELQLDQYLDMSKGPSDVSNDYLLHSVLVHSGDVNGGHYYAYIRPESEFWSNISAQRSLEDGPWFKFDDEVVTGEQSTAAFDKCFGRPKGTLVGNMASAYMLVYVRKSEAEDIMKNIKKLDIPKHLIDKLNREREQTQMLAHKEFIRKHTCCIEFFTEDDIAMFENFNSGQTFVNINDKAANSTKIDILKSPSYSGIVLEIARKLNLKVYDIRVWLIDDREENECRIDCNIWQRCSVGEFSQQDRKDPKKFFVEIVKGRKNLLLTDIYKNFDAQMADLEDREKQFVEHVRKVGGGLGESDAFPYDVAEGLGLGKNAELTLQPRLPGIEPLIHSNLLDEFQQMHADFVDLMTRVAQLDGDVCLSTLVFVRAFDPRKTITTSTYKDLIPATKAKFPHVGVYYIQKSLTFADLASSILSDFVFKLDASVQSYWQNAGTIRLRKDGRLIRDDTDMDTIDGEILCLEAKSEQYAFDEFMKYERYKKVFSIAPATLNDAKIVRKIKYDSQYTREEEAAFENFECKHTTFSLEISTLLPMRTLYMEVSRFLGVHWSLVRLRMCLPKQLINLPNNADQKVLTATYEMQILEKFHTHIISKGHSCLAYSILPIPWLDESSGRKLKGRLLDLTLDGYLSSKYQSRMESTAVLGSRTATESNHIGRSDLKRSKTEELNEFIATNGDFVAEYEQTVTRDVIMPYTMLFPSSLCLFVPENNTVADLCGQVRMALDIPFIDEINEVEEKFVGRVQTVTPAEVFVLVDENNENDQDSGSFIQQSPVITSSSAYQPFSSESPEHSSDTLLITLGRKYRTRRICSPSEIASTIIEKSWMEQVSPTEDSIQIQFITREEKLLMANRLHPGRSSSIIAVFNFQMYGAYCRPIEYLDNFSPLVTYITEDDSIHDLKKRIGAISGENDENDGFEKCRLAFFKKENGPPVFLDETTTEGTPVDENDKGVENGVVANKDSKTRSSSLSLSVWSQFVQVYPDWESAVASLRKDLSSSMHSVIVDGSIPVIGLQRHVHVDGKSHRRVASAIKIM